MADTSSPVASASNAAAVAIQVDTYLFPLSYQQRRLWFVHQLEPHSPMYNMALNLRLIGALDAGALEKSLSEIVRRHEILRTSFPVKDGEPKQEVHPPQAVELPLLDLSHFTAAEREDKARLQRQQEYERPFDLEQGPPLRVGLVKLQPQEHILQIVMHHIISDGWSEAILERELQALYDAYRGRRPSPLKELEIQYADYSLWQREWLQGDVMEMQVGYWREKLAGLPVLEIPRDHMRPQTVGRHGEVVHFRLSGALNSRLKELAAREEVTLFMVLLAGFQVLLSKYTGQTDIGVGTVIANRSRKETEGLIGFFVNTLVLRTDLSGKINFCQLLKRVQSVALGAYARQDVPFEKLVEELNPERSIGGTPFIQAGIVLQNMPDMEIELGGLQLVGTKTEHKYSFVDLGISLQEEVDDLSGTLIYSTEIYEKRSMERLAAHFKQVLQRCVDAPEILIGDIPLLTEAEHKSLVVDWNRTAREYPGNQLVMEMFEEHAARNPQARAVVYEGQHLSYGELNERANQLAHHLRGLGVGPETRVGLCVERDLGMVVSILGVLKAGAAYVPMDPLHPVERLEFVLKDAEASVLLTTTALRDRFALDKTLIVCLDQTKAIKKQSRLNPKKINSMGDLAYIIYTSGSTGTPKGVLALHAGLANVIKSSVEILQITPESRVSQLASLTFDASVAEILGPLCSGASVCIVSSRRLLSGAEFIGLLRSEAITVLGCVPSILALFSPDLVPHLRTVIVGGESCPPETASRWMAKTKLLNAYAPTEATIYSNLHECRSDGASALPLGRPLPNVRMYILDNDLNPLPIGVIGEIYIGGVGVTRGYWRRPDLTASLYRPDPFSDQPGVRVYKTGDRARLREDGNVEFMGRVDDQVKLRGYRIELGEIESIVRQIPGVQQCVVSVWEDPPGNKRLIAYLTRKQGAALDMGEMRRLVRGKLPEYMSPATYVVLDQFPLTPNGKVDKRALPAPHFGKEDTGTSARTPLEEILTGIWIDVLGVEKVGVHDNFFDLGGHSLLATKIIARTRKAGLNIPLVALFETPTVAQLAEKLRRMEMKDAALIPPPIEAHERPEQIPLSFAQQRLWLLDQLEPDQHTYTVPLLLRLRGKLNVDVLGEALSEIVRRHEILRTSFPIQDGHPWQVISSHAKTAIKVIDLTHLDADARELRIRELADAEVSKPFDLPHGPILRIALYLLGPQEHVLSCTVHHIAFDASSVRVFLRELVAVYAAFLNGNPSPLPELPVQFADIAIWERNWLQGDVLRKHLDYWSGRLTNCSQCLNLPLDFPRPEVCTFRAAMQTLSLSADLAQELEQLERESTVTGFMVLLALINIWLFYYTRQDDILVGTPVSNRSQLEMEPMIGFFINTLVFRSRIDGKTRFNEYLEQVRVSALEAYAYQALPFEKLLDELRVERSPSRNPLFQVMFNTVSEGEAEVEIPGLEVEAMDPGPVESSFDLHLGAYSSSQGIDLVCTYSTGLFTANTISSMLLMFGELARMVTESPQATINELVMGLERFDQQEGLGRKREQSRKHAQGIPLARRRPPTPAQENEVP